jgi:nicotinamide riboside kinase
MKESGVSEWELDAADYLALLEGQYALNKKLINSHENHGVFFADTDSMVTRMYAEAYAEDKDLALTAEDFRKIAMVADEFTKKCRWDKIFLLAPKGAFVDDHIRYMAHSDIDTRSKMFEILCRNIKESGNWDKVTILEGGNYYENFTTIVNYVREQMARGE